MDFTLSKYKKLLQTIQNENYEFYRMEDWFSKKIDRGVIIRHDVDRRAKNSLQMARLEKSVNIISTYYFRIKKCSFKPDIMKEINRLGHEIGYHYEELSTANNNVQSALENFGKNLARIREICKIKTIAMHGKPDSNIDNRNLFKNVTLDNYGLLGDAYISIDYSDKYYFSDTGRTWANKSKKNYRDYVNSLTVDNIYNTDDLINFIKNKKPSVIFLMTHPERWNSNPINYLSYFLRDLIMGAGKIVLNGLKN